MCFFGDNFSFLNVTQLKPGSSSAAAVAYLFSFRVPLSSLDLARGSNHAGRCSFVAYRWQIGSIKQNLKESSLEMCMAVWSRMKCVCLPPSLLQSANRTNEVFEGKSAGQKLHSWKMDQQFSKNHHDKNSQNSLLKVPRLGRREVLEYLITVCNFRNHKFILSLVYTVLPK